MDAFQFTDCWRQLDDTSRPWRFLVSTTQHVKNLKVNLGSADYSYGFVLNALAPALEQVGQWELVPHPESSLHYRAARAVEEGCRPVHLSLTPLQSAYLTPAVPSIVFPFWEFPRIPDRDFRFDTRQNWARVSRHAALIITACRLTADGFRKAGVTCPIEIVPVPLEPDDFQIPAWSPYHQVRLQCRHVVVGAGQQQVVGETVDPVSEPVPEPRLQGMARVRRGVKNRYKRHIRPLLSERAANTISQAKLRLVRRLHRAGLERVVPAPPRVPMDTLVLGGLVYTSIFNLGDDRKNPRDLLSAFLIAFRDRPDVTLVLKLAANPATEWHELERLHHLYASLGLEHRCRLVVIPDFLTEPQMRDLLQATTFYVNTSRAEGACLPLQRALAAGRPGIAPRHTAMADYMDDRIGFVIGSDPEPTHWPHDPERRCETTWHRLVWPDLRDQYLRSAKIADHDPETYHRLATAARSRMLKTATQQVSAQALSHALRHLENHPIGANAWSA